MEIYPNITSDLNIERNIWKNYIIDKLIAGTDKCPLCSHPYVNMVENNTLNNPYIARCNNVRCRRIIYLREGKNFNHFPRTACSNILYIIKLWLFENKNANEIHNKFRTDFSNINISLIRITEILQKLREYIAHYIKDTYILEDISEENRMPSFAIDESNFYSDGNSTTWVIGIINITSRKIRLEFSHDRNTSTMKKIIGAHIKKGNIIVSDSWGAYRWLDNGNSGYVHSNHTHTLGNFGSGEDSTSHIEQLWAHLKFLIKIINNMIPKNNFIYFLRESEYRRNLSFLSANAKWAEIYGTLNYIKNLGIDTFYSEDELKKITEK